MGREKRWLVASFVLFGMLGYWLARTAVPRDKVRSAAVHSDPETKRLADDPAPRFESGKRVPLSQAAARDDEAIKAGALTGQRVVVFKDKAALEAFLKRAGEKVSLLGRLDALNALRVGFSNYDDLAAVLQSEEKDSLIYPVDLPTPLPSDGTAQPGAIALGADLLKWLGITTDNSAWGKGVKIAVLDTGVTSSTAFSSPISSFNLVDLSANQNGHGTAVASMIIGRNSVTPGVAPGAEIISIRIADDLGASDSFLLAQGIVAAVDRGAQLINISMGSAGDSALVRNALDYAKLAGSLVIAAAGNNGLQRVSYPAANQGVIAVGAVDAAGNHLDFSNSGAQVAIAAPGYGVNAAWTGNKAASVNGTSFSAPIVTGAIAALMSQPGSAQLTPLQAKKLLFAYLNDGGEAGNDSAYGGGMPDLGRAINAKKPGIYDAALASQRLIPPDSKNPNGQVEIMVQNRGTEPLINTGVRISTPNGVTVSNITQLAVNGVKTIRVSIPTKATGNLRYESSVNLSGGRQDSKPSNDRRTEIYVPSNPK
jgi:Subtilase family